MQHSNETRMFFRLVDMFDRLDIGHRELKSWWNEDKEIVMAFIGLPAEATFIFEDNSHFHIELRTHELDMSHIEIAVPSDATEYELEEIVRRVTAFLANPEAED